MLAVLVKTVSSGEPSQEIIVVGIVDVTLGSVYGTPRDCTNYTARPDSLSPESIKSNTY